MTTQSVSISTLAGAEAPAAPCVPAIAIVTSARVSERAQRVSVSVLLL